MPPRRSTRSARPSVEPQAPPRPAPATTASKRKRSQPAVDDIVEEQNEEPIVKPASRTRKSSTRSNVEPNTTGRTSSTRSTRKPLQEVPETDQEEEETRSAPPAKKPRPSEEVGQQDVEGAEEEEVKPAKKGRGRSVKKDTVESSGVRKGKKVPVKVVELSSDGEGEGEVAPPPPPQSKTRKTPAKRASVKPESSKPNGRTSSRSSRGKKAVKAEHDEEEVPPPPRVVDISDEDEVDGTQLASTGAPTTSAATTNGQSSGSALSGPSSSVHTDGVESAMDVSEREDPPAKPASKGRKIVEVVLDPITPSAKALYRRAPGTDEEVKLDVAEQEQDEVHPAHGEVEPPQLSEPEEEEHSLLDPPVKDIPQRHEVPAAKVEEEPKGPKSRLVIHKMVLINFKSYAGRQEIGPFHKSFSAIVGPNGSGKSNTIDALLFVFGWRASKMRQGKLSELIHNSAHHPDLDDCSVEVHFREIVDLPGPDAYEVVPDSNLVIARTAYKSNNSKYTINRVQSNFTEVRNLLKDRGIDLDHKRFLILQGEVESIAQMKPKAPSEHEDGLLEYLEDIIGTSCYKAPIEEALVEMDRLSEERVEKLNRLKIVEREKAALEEKKREAVDYLKMQNEHVRALSRLWQWYLWRCLINDAEYEKKIGETSKALEHEREQNKDDVTHLEMLEKHFDEREAAYEEVKAAAAEAIKDLATYEKQAIGLEEKRKHANTKAKKLKKALHDDEHNRTEAVRTIETTSSKIEKEKANVRELEASLSAEEKVLEDITESLKGKTQVFHDQIEAKQKELQPWMAKINTKQAAIDVATSERDGLVKKAESAKEAYKEAQETLETLRAGHEAKVAELSELQQTRAGLQNQFQSGGKKQKELQAQAQDLRTKSSSARQKADEAKASQAANTSQNKVLDSLTRLKNSGRIHGFHGRLGSLGTIEDKYDVAISTACPSLNNLIVDTVDQGQACIEYLRKQNVGRASFIVLEKLPRNNIAQIQTPEGVPRLFDLIKPKEPRFAPAFFKAVHNTLVAKDLEQANRIAFGGQKRWRVVTLAGQLIESSGAMSGGGTHVARGGMSSKLAADSVAPEVLKKYEDDSEKAAAQLEEILGELRQLEQELDHLSKAGPQTDIAIQKVNLDIQAGANKIAEAEKRLRELKSQIKPDSGDVARIATLDETIDSAMEELAELQERSGTIEKAIKALNQKIIEIGGAKLLSQKSKVDGIKVHINIANDEITKAEVAKAKAEKDVAKLNVAIETNSKSLEDSQTELQALEKQLEECTEYVDELRENVEAAKSAADNSKEDLDNLKAELDAKTEEIQAFRQREMELQQTLDGLKKESSENERSLDHWKEAHDKLKLEEIDDDDEDEDENSRAQNKSSGGEKVKREPGDGAMDEDAPDQHDPLELHVYTEDELEQFKKRELVADAELLDEKLKNAKPNMAALEEYKKRDAEFMKRAADLENTTNLRDEQKQKYDGLRKQRLDEFMAGFTAISLKLKEMYQMITLGGNAELELVDNMDPFSEGVIFSVMPPKKSWKNISHLSGGEKTLSSLALVFALHHFKPTPLYFMDEIDAALDFRNVSIVANYIKDRTKNAQFIIISLRNDMFELSHRLIGIYKTSNQTRSISIDNRALTAVPVRPRPIPNNAGTQPSNGNLSVAVA
ncbi:hypothetical protein JAAARDRAFT_362087 [Jaapia argillacea MUCL 33604]|uniref:Structural maintenance of chromosomes protein 4 n=1 Tax=Jaapia argillacea MUCL 33604 TaxID=933084 RepID=A0A067Q7G7_9AGAM|nr:hypothetical protein JAAARDRAFT_362087 [Jaapia argillacea MUCL 33604]